MLHFHSRCYRRSALFKCRHHAIAYGLDDSATMALHDPAKDVVAVMNHHESGSISMFFEICGRPLNVGKHYRDRATKLTGSISMFFEICGRPLNVGKHYRDRATKLFEFF